MIDKVNISKTSFFDGLQLFIDMCVKRVKGLIVVIQTIEEPNISNAICEMRSVDTVFEEAFETFRSFAGEIQNAGDGLENQTCDSLDGAFQNALHALLLHRLKRLLEYPCQSPSHPLDQQKASLLKTVRQVLRSLILYLSTFLYIFLVHRQHHDPVR